MAVAAASEMSAAGVSAALRSVVGEAAAVGAVTREGTRLRLERVRVPIVHGAVRGEALIDADVALGRLLGGAVAPSLERVTARVTLDGGAGKLVLDVRFEAEHVTAPGLVSSGSLAVAARVAVRALERHGGTRDAVTLHAKGRLLVDDTRVYVHALEVEGPGTRLRGDGSVAPDGSSFRARAEGHADLAHVFESFAFALPPRALPRAGAPLRVALDASGSLAAPHVVVRARGEALLFSMGKPRWMPAERLDSLEIRASLDAVAIALEASARSGQGELTVSAREVFGSTVSPAVTPRVRATLSRWPARWIDAGVALPTLGLPASLLEALASATLDAEVALYRDDVAADTGTVTLSTRRAGTLRVDGCAVASNTLELRVSSARLALPLGERAADDARPICLEDVDAVARVTLRRRTQQAEQAGRRGVSVRFGPVTARTFGGELTAEGEASLGAGAQASELRVRLEGAGPELLAALAALAPASALRVTCAPLEPEAARVRGEAWLPRQARLGAEVRVTRAQPHLTPSINARVTASSAQTDLVLEVSRDATGPLAGRLAGRLGLGEAQDLGLFDGGALPARDGHVELTLDLSADLALAGALSAPALAFGPSVLFEDVRALVSLQRGVTVWSDVRARLAGGRVALDALVDRAGSLGGMRAHVVLDDVDVAILSGGVAEGRLALEIALEQHGQDDAPLLGAGAVVVRAGAVPDLARRVGVRVGASVAARNARARGEVTARLALDGTALRLLDLVVPLPDAWVRGDVRLGPSGDLEAHLEVHARELLVIPVRIRGGLGGGAPALEVDVLSAALVGHAAARARRRGRSGAGSGTRAIPVRRDEALARAVAEVDWVALARRAGRQS